MFHHYQTGLEILGDGTDQTSVHEVQTVQPVPVIQVGAQPKWQIALQLVGAISSIAGLLRMPVWRKMDRAARKSTYHARRR